MTVLDGTWGRWLVLTVMLGSVLSGFAAWASHHGAITRVRDALQETLPARIDAAEINSLGRPDVVSLLRDRLNQDLATLPVTGLFVRTCRGAAVSLDGQSLTPTAVTGQGVALQWQTSGRDRSLELVLDCAVRIDRILVIQWAIAAFLAAALVALPLPLGTQTLALRKRLIARGLPRDLADRCAGDPAIQALSDAQLDWYVLAQQRYLSAPEALAVAQADPDLVFLPQHTRVSAHGLTITLSPTPFIYYYWYALWRVGALSETSDRGDGWFPNPPSNRPDWRHSADLVAVMERLGGHRKAINDLQDKGLRARTLDQNRSKIKDELVAVLGEALAAPYLFDMARDPGTARYQYRISLAPDQIHLPS